MTLTRVDDTIQMRALECMVFRKKAGQARMRESYVNFGMFNSMGNRSDNLLC